MALTVTVNKTTVIGSQRLVTFTLAFDSSYPTGGESLTAADIGLTGGQVDFLACTPKSGMIFEYDYTNKKLMAFFPTGGAGTPASALATPSGLAASGASTASAVDATRPTVAILPGVGKEVANLQNLSTLTGVRGYAIGV